MKIKEIKFFIMFLIIILVFTNNSYASAETETEIDIETETETETEAYAKIYLNVKLTRPLVNKKTITIKSDFGFSLFSIEDKNNPLLIIDEIVLKVKKGEDGNISLMDELDNLIYSIPMDGSLIIGSNSIESSIIKVENSNYRDFLRFLIQENEVIVTNHVELNNYLYGVLPFEMSPSYALEALKAQAIASRNFALTSTKHDKYNYNLCDTTDCQVYGGFDREHANTNLAVDETKNILAYYEGELITAYYHSTSSGYTEDSGNVWSADIPYLKSVEDQFSSEAPNSSWSINLNIQELRRRLELAGYFVGEIREIYTTDINSTGKVENVKIVGGLAEVIITGAQFRNIIGNTDVKSAWFTVQNGGDNDSSQQVYVIDGITNEPKLINISTAFKEDKYSRMPIGKDVATRALGINQTRDLGIGSPISSDEIVIQGRGSGHGVGMSQHGAIKMAELGYNFEDILKYYYTGIDVIIMDR